MKEGIEGNRRGLVICYRALTTVMVIQVSDTLPATLQLIMTVERHLIQLHPQQLYLVISLLFLIEISLFK